MFKVIREYRAGDEIVTEQIGWERFPIKAVAELEADTLNGLASDYMREVHDLSYYGVPA